MNQESVHRCRKYPLEEQQGRGWEFVCQTCGYRARYTLASQQLVVLNPGNPQARHTSAPESITNPLARPMTVIDRPKTRHDDRYYLPEYLVEQIEAILEHSGW